MMGNKLTIEYNREFISNKIRDELVLYDINNYEEVELEIINDIEKYFDFSINKNWNINKLSGGQRSIAYLITLSKIINNKDIAIEFITLKNIMESLSTNKREILYNYLKNRSINVITE